MENTISIPKDLYRQAEELAQRLGVSRSELYTCAMKILLETYRDAEITRRLNEIYEQEESALDPVYVQMQAISIEPEGW